MTERSHAFKTIEACVERLGITRFQLAGLLGVEPTLVYRWQRLNGPSGESALLLLDMLIVELDKARIAVGILPVEPKPQEKGIETARPISRRQNVFDRPLARVAGER